MEHEIGATVLERLIRFAEFLQTCPRTGADWLQRFREACSDRKVRERCEECIRECPKNLERGTNGTQALTEFAASELSIGERGAVVALKGQGPVRRRLMDLGVVAGSVLEIERVAPLGDPIEIKLKGFHLALRKDEAANVVVRPL